MNDTTRYHQAKLEVVELGLIVMRGTYKLQELEQEISMLKNSVRMLEEDARQHTAFRWWIDGRIQSDLDWTECMRHMKRGQLPPFCQPGQCVAGCDAR